MRTRHFISVCRCLLLVALVVNPTVALAQLENSSRKVKNIHQKSSHVPRIATTGTQQSPVVNLQDYIQKIDELFDQSPIATNPKQYFDETNEAIATYIKILKPQATKQIHIYYYEAFYDAGDNDQLDDAVNIAFKYLMTGGKNEEDVMWKLLVDNYASDGDTENTIYLLEKFKQVSTQNNDVYSEIITSLEAEYDDVIHPVPFEDAAQGYWISLKDKKQLKKKNDMLIPDFIITLSDLRNENGGWLASSPKYPYHNKEKYRLSTSQTLFCDVDSLYLRMVFATEEMKYGNTRSAHKHLEENRQWKADMHGKINSSNGNFGQKLAGEVITEFVGGFFDGMARSEGESSKTGEAYEVEFYGMSPVVMDANISYRKVKMSSSGYTQIKESIPNQKYTFVKCEPDDSIIFIDKDEKVIKAHASMMDEYNNIKKKYNPWRKPQYVIPAVLSIGSFGFCYTCAFIQLFKSQKNYDKGESDAETRRLKQAGIWFGSALASICIMIPFDNHYSKKRRQAFNELNERSMEKMRQKAASLSIAPTYIPMDNAVGMNLNLTF